MDVVQLSNGVAALLGFAAATWSYFRFHDRTSKPALAAHLINGTLLLWYAAVNLSVGAGVWEPDLRQLTKMFRWAFAPLVLSYAIRQLFAIRWSRKGSL